MVIGTCLITVSYTHLDVYKRQVNAIAGISRYERNSEKRTESVNSILVPDFKNISNSNEYPSAKMCIRDRGCYTSFQDYF